MLTTVAEFLSVVVNGVADLGAVTSALMARGERHPVGCTDDRQSVEA